MLQIVFPLLLNSQSTITTTSLLNEISDLDGICKAPPVWFKTSQASSYDRASVVENGDGWFANGDYGKYLRSERNEGRTENVMADIKGPGAVVRIWSANPAGTIRFYFDGETTPRITSGLGDLLSAKSPWFKGPFSFQADRGWNLYFPMPFAKSLKVTLSEAPDNVLKSVYYHIGYRQYAAETIVETFDPKRIDQKAVARIAEALTKPKGYASNFERNFVAAAGQSGSVELPEGSKVVRQFNVKLNKAFMSPGTSFDDPRQMHQMLRHTELRITFDGVNTVAVPLGDFFASPPFNRAYNSLPMEVTPDGTMICRFVMPYEKSAKVEFVNHGDFKVAGTVTCHVAPFNWNSSSWHFYSQWNYDRNGTRPMHDMNFVSTKGVGAYVGSVLSISNPSPSWWGEGDEKVFIDGEKFPSTIGTGTEDYFGYAWSANTIFQRPLIGQPQSEPMGNYGHSANYRWHILDRMPFKSDIRFLIEQWHWADVVATFTTTAYWYGKTGEVDRTAISKDRLQVIELAGNKGEEGATEAEDMERSISGGKVENQGGFIDLSKGLQVWWQDSKKGDTLTLKFDVPRDGEYNLKGKFCYAGDYGIHQLSLNGQSLGQMDFFGKGVSWKVKDFGTIRLKAGKATLVVTNAGANAEAEQRFMFGIDWLKLTPQ